MEITHEWMWQSNPDPHSESETPEWTSYSDIENMIIEKAFRRKQPTAKIGDYHIDFKTRTQISNQDDYRQRPVKRVARPKNCERFRRERFAFNPVSPKRPYGGEYGWVSPFILEVRNYLKLEPNQLPSKDKKIIPMLVEKAAMGIQEEGKTIGKQCEAERIADILLKTKNKTMKDVWSSCAYLYTVESFLYKILNETMRLIGSEDHEQIWRDRVPTLGPYALLLWDDPFNTKLQTGKILYRAARLTDEEIARYKEISKHPEEYHSFQSFLSSSRNPNIANLFPDMNVLFVMEVLLAFSADLKPVSLYPAEEEELITPGVCFVVQGVHFDAKTSRYIINLKLRQRFSREY